MFVDQKKYSYNDIKVQPAVISNINHRYECNTYDENGMLPIFAAPMTSIVDENNYTSYINNKIIPIIPRSVDYNTRYSLIKQGIWVALSLDEFTDLFINQTINFKDIDTPFHVLLDIANGHMMRVIYTCKAVKEKYLDNVIIMAGNIANPETYIEYCNAGIDYVRCGIGSGGVCITSSQTAIHYPMASLIDEIRAIKESMPGFTTKIIADGGIRNYDDVIKALSLGADYVMIGSLFAEMEEACGEIFRTEDGTLVRQIFGMASAQGQIAINGVKTKTSEGIVKTHPVKYTLPKWTENMSDYIRSAMSYGNCKHYSEIYYNTKCYPVSANTVESINK